MQLKRLFSLVSTKRGRKQLLLVIFCVAFFIRLGVGLAYLSRFDSNDPFWTMADRGKYLSYAQAILDQGVSVPDPSQLHRRVQHLPPGLPLFLAGIFSLFGKGYPAMVLTHVVISTCSVILLFYLGSMLFHERVGQMAAAWGCFYVSWLSYIPMALKEVWLILLFPLVIYLHLLVLKHPSGFWKPLFLASAYVLLIHVDERYFAYFPLFCISFFMLDPLGWRLGTKKAVFFFITVCLGILPWAIRNYQIYDRPILLTERTAFITDRLLGYSPEPSYLQRKREARSRRTELRESMIAQIRQGKPISGAEIRDPWYQSIRLQLEQGLIPHRYALLEKWFVAWKEFWRPVRFKPGYIGDGFELSQWPWRKNLMVGTTYGLLIPFFLFGSFQMVRRRHRYGIFLLLVLFSHNLISMGLALEQRHRYPMDSIVLVVAFYGVYLLWQRRRAESC